ncbi:MAG TPA: hypothetical protein VFU05_20385 [Cyclobacteriaceae bacterium]|nr:hypothetical protein [Cyclobacteriaceae bacterium]
MNWKLFIVLCFLRFTLCAQDTIQVKKIDFRGYIKDMQTLTFDEGFDQLITNNLIHNRLNFKWDVSSVFRIGAEFRTRLYWGEQVRLTPDFADQLSNSNEAIDMSIIWFEKESMVLHTNVDRLWLEYKHKNVTARVGRQRINWGIGSTWNPNDLFNTFNFLDFDYEERPGSDAVNVQYRMGPLSNIEVTAAATSADEIEGIAAGRYFFNKANFDFQLIAGWYFNDFTAGLGWTGSFGGTGFKGEMQHFFSSYDSARLLNLVIEADRVFGNGWYTSAGFLFNSQGLSQPVENWQLVNFQLSPRNLMPTQWNLLYTIAKDITPLLNGSFGVVYAPGTNLMILLPTIQYNIETNLDISLVWQSFFIDQSNEFKALSHSAFIRFKWSF